MAAIQFRQVRKCYGSGSKAVEVIGGIDADIADGEFVVMVGPSGCGKSTLLRMVAGLEEVSGGEIRIGARVVNQLEPAQRDIAMVFQNYALYPHMTVRENMAYGLKIQRLPKAEIAQRVQHAAAALELDALLERTPRQLSGGQRQRVAMGRAIVRQPAVFLFDEPLSNLDARLRVQMRLEIQKLHARLRTTSLYVTHDQVEAMTLGQRMIVMRGGVAEQIGTPAEVYARPATTFVAGFIGSPPMNLLQGTIGADGAILDADGGAASVRLPQAVPAWAGQRRIMGVRPEHMRLRTEGGSVLLEVELVEALGAELLVHARCADQTMVLRCAANAAIARGQRIGVDFDDAHVHWFDAQTGHRLGE